METDSNSAGLTSGVSRRSFFVQPQLVGSGEDRQTRRQNIGCGINVPVVVDSAFRAVPLPGIQAQHFENMPTGRTAFAAGIPLVDLNKGTSVPVGLVFQLAHNLAPAHI